MSKTCFEKTQPGQHAYSMSRSDSEFDCFLPPLRLLRKNELMLPEMSEIDITRHFCELAAKNVGIDNEFYPLGSCTMKFNPRVNEQCSALPGFSSGHPLAPEEMVQGNLQIIFELVEMLCALCGMEAGSLLPCAGAHGEYTGIKMISAYHSSRGDHQRSEILIPDDAHGTNPATASMAGYRAISIHTNVKGEVDLDHLRQMASERTAALMLTNPNTLGLFNSQIRDIAEIIHGQGGMLYYDGANLNAILNVVKPGEMGFDVMHLNLHKTFSTPHGGGGPGSGPVLCNEKLAKFLPIPRVEKDGNHFKMSWKDVSSIGQICSFHGNFAIYLRAYLYAKLHGNYGLRRIAENAVLNANYLKSKLIQFFTIPYSQSCMHEFVIQADNYLDKGIKALDIAKRLLDYGMHAPTIYFPLIVKECMLVEPTEVESKATLDQFVEAMAAIIEEIQQDPELVRTAPHKTPVSRLDEVLAAKKPILKAQLK